MSVEFRIFMDGILDHHTAKRIRRHAKKQGLRAQRSRSTQYKSMWFFADTTNHLYSDRNGLDNNGAIAFLKQYPLGPDPDRYDNTGTITIRRIPRLLDPKNATSTSSDNLLL